MSDKEITMTTIAALCKCGMYIAIVSSTAGQREINHVYDIARATGCQVVKITRDDVRQRFGACECKKLNAQEAAGQLPLFEAER